MTTIAVVDNYDSFTYNLVEYLSTQTIEGTSPGVEVFRNTVDLSQIEAAAPDAVVISPGPGHPAKSRDVGVTIAVLEELAPQVPVLGVCLGLEAAVHVYGGVIDRAPHPVHGKTSQIVHDGKGIYADLPAEFVAGRYHSLIAADVPDELAVTAWTADADALIMGVRHREYPVEAVQFHPESVLTGVGHQLIGNFLHNYCTRQ
jgi:anthranilate synthase component 2